MSVVPIQSAKSWYVYVLGSASTGRSYVGISLDAAKRLLQHNAEVYGKSPASTRHGRPWAIHGLAGPFTHGDALRIEVRVKKAKGLEKRLARMWPAAQEVTQPELQRT